MQDRAWTAPALEASVGCGSVSGSELLAQLSGGGTSHVVLAGVRAGGEYQGKDADGSQAPYDIPHSGGLLYGSALHLVIIPERHRPRGSGMGRWHVIWFFRFLLLGFAVFGVVLIWKGWHLRRLTPAVLRMWTETTGVVVDVLRRKSVGDDPRQRLRFFHKLEYADPSGRTHHVWTEIGLRHELPRGTVLPLRYEPGNPSRATTLDPEAGGGTASGWGIVVGGAVFLLIGGYGSVLTWI